MKKMLRLGLVPLTALTLAAVVNAPVVRAEETISTGVASTLPEPQTPPENQQQPKTITVDLVSKAEDGTVLETITRELNLNPEPGIFGWSYSYKDRANHIAGYRLSHYNRHEVTYDEVQNGDRVVLEAIFKPVAPDQLDEDALTFSVVPYDTNLKPLPLEPKTVVIYPGEIFYPNVTNSPVYLGYEFRGVGPVTHTYYDKVKEAIAERGSYSFGVLYSPAEPKEELKNKTITIELVSKAENGTVLDTYSRPWELVNDPQFANYSYNYIAYNFAGYRLSHYTRQEVTYDEVEDGDKVVLEAIYKPVDPNKLDEDALTFAIQPIDINRHPLPLEPKTVTVYPGEVFYPKVTNTPVYPDYTYKSPDGIASYDMVKEAITKNGSFTLSVIYSPVEPKEELKNKTITIIEERQDEEGRVIFKKEHVFNLKPHQEEQLPLDQTLDQLIRGSNIASWDAYDDGAVIHFTTRRRPKADKPDTTLDDLKKDQQTPEVKPNSVPTPKPEDKPTPTPVPKDLSADRNKLLLSLDESKLTDEQKGKLAEKIAFAETEKDLADLKAELVTLVKAVEKSTEKTADKPMTGKTEVKAPTPVATAKPAANMPAKSDKVALPATGDGARLGLLAAGFSLLLLGLGLAKARKHN